MDKYEKRVLYTGIVLMAIFLGAILYSSKVMGDDLPECLPGDALAYDKGEVTQLDEKTYQIKYIAKMWAFEPRVVEIPRGAEVDIFLTSKDVVHGFLIENTTVNMMAVYGALNKITYRFDKPGTYRIVCHEYCGVGHQDMAGVIIVK